MRSFFFVSLAAIIVLALGLRVPPVHAGDAALIMFEQEYCEWCDRWDAEIAPIYPKTREGARAPLRRVDIHEPMPDDLAWLRKERFTPSFVLIRDDHEVGRIRGYPGEDFFWGLLGALIKDLDQADPERKSAN